MGDLISGRRSRIVALAIAATTMANVAYAAQPLVRSKDGRLQAFPVPERIWCGDVVGIRLQGAPGLLERDPAFVQKFLAGARAAVVAECKRAKGIRFHAQEGEGVGFRAYSSKDAGWAIFLVPAVDRSQAGQSGSKLDDKARRAIAKIDALSLDERAGARHAEFLSNAEAGTAHAAWRLSNVSLGLTIRETKLARPIPLKAIADAISGRVAKVCRKIEGAEAGGLDDKVMRRTFICRQPPNSYGYGIIAYVDGPHLHLIALKSSRADEDNSKNLKSVAAAFERIISKDW
jgi:hypothetical protein